VNRTRRGTRALQWVFLVLLVFSVAQVVWWVYDQERLAAREHRRLQDLYAGERVLAQQLLIAQRPLSEWRDQVPHVIVANGEVLVSPAAVAALDHERASRLRRYLFEGGFFLSVLIACMGVLWITLREEAELSRRQANFIAAVTHEFKSPLSSLQLAIETIGLRNPPAERLRELLAQMSGDVQRLENMVSKILDTAGLESGRLRLVQEPMSLAETVGTAIAELRERAVVSRVAMRAEVAPGLEISADPVAVRTVLRNLLENALRATAPSGTVRVTAAARDEFVVLSVIDDGVGFEPAEAGKLFEKFYRPGDELRRTGKGTGLGLFIVRRFVELQRGWVSAHSAGPGRGATFTVAWPRAARRAA
jgi:signal transduction histidine kinase